MITWVVNLMIDLKFDYCNIQPKTTQLAIYLVT